MTAPSTQKPLLDWHEAQRLTLENVQLLSGREICDTGACLNRILATAILAQEPFPRFDQSAMDGFAVRCEDLNGASPQSPVKLPVAASIFAGQREAPELVAGQCARISTGSPIPPGADAVVPKELVRCSDSEALFAAEPAVGDHIRFAGEDVRKDDTLLPAGHRLNAASVGLLSMHGIQRVDVVRLPRIAIIATGNELAAGDQPLNQNQIRDSNTPALVAALSQTEFEVSLVSRAKDEESEVAAVLKRALGESDFVLTTGGVSVGDRDYVRPILGRMGVEEIFWRVAQKPGKPLYLGRRDMQLVFGLPGNPLAVMVCFYEYVLPALHKAAGFGTEHWRLQRVDARLDSPVRCGERTEFVPALTEWNNGRYAAKLISRGGSHLLTGLSRANSLAVLPGSSEALSAGATVEVHLLP